MKILIIGGGIAAFEAAVAAAEQKNIEVTVCSREAVLPYRRPALSRMVSESITDNAFYLKDAAFYRERGIDIKLEKEALRIDRKKKQVFFKDGDTIGYDRLIIAAGGYAFVPPVEGHENACVLRDYDDLQQIKQRLDEGIKNAVIIGCGVLGLELADSLLAKKCAVTVLESGASVLSRQLDPESSAAVQKHLESIPDFSLKTGVSVKKITPESVELTDGTVIGSGLTVFSTGVRSNSKIAAEAGIEVKQGIVVSSNMQSSDPEIYACGDVAEPPCGSYGLLSAAKAMGHAAGINAAGGNEEFVPDIYPVRLMALGIKLFSAGKINDAKSKTVCDGGNFQRLTYNACGDLTGAILLGDLKSAVKLQKEMVR